MPRNEFVTPVCCKEVQEHKTVFLSVFELMERCEPVWKIRSFNSHFQCTGTVKAEFCPHCGTNVPEVEKSKTSKKICVMDDMQDYCETCSERLRVCSCLPEEFEWKPKQ
jgi:hypothetical protein